MNWLRTLLRSVVVFGIMVCAVLVAASMVMQASDNLLQNPGFEELDENGRAIGWSNYVPAGEGHVDAVSISTDAHSGQYAALIDVAQGLSGVEAGKRGVRQNFQQRIDAHSDFVIPGRTYRFSAYYRTEGNPKARLTVQIPGLTHPTTGELPPADDWTYVEVEFTWPPADKWAALGLWVWNANEGRVWFDDVQLVLLDN